MKSLLIAVNSKYIHAALAPWYLKAACRPECGEVKVMEFTINDSPDSVLARIYSEQPDTAAFSCYIWNIGFVLKLAANLKKVLPHTTIILGGPEVTYDSEDVLGKYDFVDYVLAGEGEASISGLLLNITRSGRNRELELQSIPGLSYRNSEGNVVSNRAAVIENLDSICTPYTDEMLSSLGNRIAYFESSRGCPFSCSYCLSSITKGVRYFSLDRVFRDLTRLAGSGARQVKFVDRTFNCNRERAVEIIRFIIDNFTDENGKAMLNFHFEAAADLFDDRLLEVLAQAPRGLVQFEIGVQTVNTDTLEAINRKTDLYILFGNFRKLRQLDNIHLHLDLIAGLPYENYESFVHSFNSVYAARPHQLQLGFLKLLKGSALRAASESYGFVFRDYPPYEVLCNNFIKYDELIILKGIEDLVDRYFNSGRFANTLSYIIGNYYDGAFGFYFELYNYFNDNDLLYKSLPQRELYSILYTFSGRYAANVEHLRIYELLRLDFLTSDNSRNLPPVLRKDMSSEFRDACFSFLKSEDNLAKYLPGYKGIPAKTIIKQVHFEQFSFDVLDFSNRSITMLFDYSQRDEVTGLYRHFKVEF